MVPTVGGKAGAMPVPTKHPKLSLTYAKREKRVRQLSDGKEKREWSLILWVATLANLQELNKGFGSQMAPVFPPIFDNNLYNLYSDNSRKKLTWPT